MGNIGERLQKARVQAGLSLPEISARTKIRTALLEAIEREEFGQLPQGLLARGFLRAYAREVGLDPETVVREFRHEIESITTGPDVAPPATTVETQRNQKEVSNRRRASPWPFIAAAILLVLAGVAAVFVSVNREPEIDDHAPSGPIETVDEGAEAIDNGQDIQQGEGRLHDDALAASDASEVDALSVAIFPARLVWVEATADGRRVLYQLVHPGEQQVIDARDELLLRVGDAGAFHYSINGVRGRQVGAPGVVRTIRITRENYKTFQDQ